MTKHIHDSQCLPYEQMNAMQRMLTSEGCSSLLGLWHKKILDGTLKVSHQEPKSPRPQKSFNDWAVTIAEQVPK